LANYGSIFNFLGGAKMQSHSSINRRDFLLTTAGTIGGATALSATPASAQSADADLPAGIHPGDPLAQYWHQAVSHLVDVKFPAALSNDVVKERHRIFSLLLMALIVRFWNGNNNGPVGIYPQREGQKVPGQDPNLKRFRYQGDLFAADDPQRMSWDRYLGHNIACLAVDGKGEVMDFDFNHNNFFRSSAEHAEARMVRRLFSLADLMDNWKTGEPIPGKSRAFALKDVTIYTSLESCAQCSGVMSLGRVKQVVYLQNDPGAYRIGNIMYNLAGQDPPAPNENPSFLAALPVPASQIGLPYLGDLNRKYEEFRVKMTDAEQNKDQSRTYFRPNSDSTGSFTTSITSFLCTDAALDVFRSGAREFSSLALEHAGEKVPAGDDVWTNQECFKEARRFFDYASVEGFRGSPHKL
jgi:tRNA(Arg) A34 adenosine deaminase TadA